MILFLLKAAFAYGVFVLAMYWFQDRFLYFPEENPLRPEAHGLEGFERITLETRDRERLIAWWHPPLPSYPVLLYCHGNAGHIGLRAPKFDAFRALGFGVLAVSYRGYGASTGIPSENGLYEDARAALAWLIEEREIPASALILYGESLGTGIAVHLGALMPVGAVVLEAPYTSVLDRARERFPFLPIRQILKARFDSLAKIGRLHSPLLVLHGERDTIIPVRHGRALLEAAPQPKEGIFLPDVAHSDFPPEVLADAVREFARRHGLLPEAP
jgi:fermentation-respiration switch protein FrsA (DUF1100 family)